MPLLDDLADYLTTEGVATVGTDLFKGGLTDTPDSQMAILEAGGFPNLETMSTGPFTHVLEQPSVQFLARGDRHDRETVRSQAQAIYEKCSGLRNRTINGSVYHYLECQPPALLAVDENERTVMTINCLIRRQRTTL